jgi:carboxymethylenebutenolidase
MCDDITESENGHWLLGRKVGRRELGAIGAGVAVLAMMPGCAMAQDSEPTAPTASRTVEVMTPDGSMDGYFVHPATGKHPAVILWPDIAGLRDAYRTMATRLAQAGYAVLVVNQYYRSARAPVLASFAEWRTDAGRARLQPMIAQLNPARITSDAAAFIVWLDRQGEVDTAKKIASSGYCMGGPFTFRTAAANPARVGAIASFHGGGLVTDAPDSPHLLLDDMRAALLIAIAQNDDERAPTDKDVLRVAASAAGRTAEIEVYPAQHGWCTIDAPVYAEAEAERAWGRMLAVFAGAV